MDWGKVQLEGLPPSIFDRAFAKSPAGHTPPFFSASKRGAPRLCVTDDKNVASRGGRSGGGGGDSHAGATKKRTPSRLNAKRKPLARTRASRSADQRLGNGSESSYGSVVEPEAGSGSKLRAAVGDVEEDSRSPGYSSPIPTDNDSEEVFDSAEESSEPDFGTFPKKKAEEAEANPRLMNRGTRQRTNAGRKRDQAAARQAEENALYRACPRRGRRLQGKLFEHEQVIRIKKVLGFALLYCCLNVLVGLERLCFKR